MVRTHEGRFGREGDPKTRDESRAKVQAAIAERDAKLAPTAKTEQALHPIFEAYVAYLARIGRDPKTVSRNAYGLRRLHTWLEGLGTDPADADETLFEEYTGWLVANVARTTAAREVAFVRAAYRYAVKRKVLDASPAADLKAPKVPDADPIPYAPDELRRIRAAIRSPFDDVLFHAYAYSGLRRSELVGLTWADVDFRNQMLSVVGKGGKVRRVPQHPVLAEVLAAWRRMNPTGESVLGRGGSLRNVNARLEVLLADAGVDGGNRPVHRFRKTVATSLFDEDVPESVIDKLMGWSPVSVRAKYYARISDAKMHEAMAKLYASDPLERPVAVPDLPPAKASEVAA